MTSSEPLELLGQGRGAEVFAWDSHTVLKLARSNDDRANLASEFAAQQSAHDAGIPTPKPIGLVDYDGRPGFLMERVAGLDLLTAVDKKPWRVWKLGRATGRLHAELASAEAPDVLPDLLEVARAVLSQSSHLPESARPRVLAVLDQLPHGTGLVHGDFHPGNVLESPEKFVAIDFADATRGDPLADHAKSMITFEAGAPPPGTGARERVLIALGRRLMMMAYRSGYREVAGEIDEEQLARWRVVAIGVRLTQGIEEERTAFLRMLSRALRAVET